MWSLACLHRVHWCRLFDAQDLRSAGSGPLVVFPPFCLLSRFALGALPTNMALFRVLRAFLAGFGVLAWVYVVLVRCVACVALYACGVRRIKGLRRVCLSFCPFAFILLPFVLSLYLLFVLRLVCFVLVVFWLSSCLVLFVLVSLWSLLFLFPFRYIRKKKGRKGLSLASSLRVS